MVDAELRGRPRFFWEFAASAVVLVPVVTVEVRGGVSDAVTLNLRFDRKINNSGVNCKANRFRGLAEMASDS